MSALSLVRELKESGEDFEWYPTTNEILSKVRSHIEHLHRHRSSNGKIGVSVLDLGAGDGRALMSLTEGDRFAIEKSSKLVEIMDDSIFVIGTDFSQQTLIDKKVDVVFCNPPYAEFAQWSTRIITEANAPDLYLVIPERWSNNQSILDAIAIRKAEAKVIGSFDFLNADRKARAKVDIVHVALAKVHDSYKRNDRPSVDPFDNWFDSHFKISGDGGRADLFEELEQSKQSFNELVGGQDLISNLEEFYQRDMGSLMESYQAICGIDESLLKEMEVSKSRITESLKGKILTLKDRYWKELFNHLSSITSRLTSDSREKLLSKLTDSTHVDFTAENAYSVVIWAIKNANQYLDSQLISIYQQMMELSNMENYKSNQKTFGDDRWRFNRMYEDGEASRFCLKLDYRIVLERCGGLCVSEWEYERTSHGLSKRAEQFIGDLQTVAANLGFDSEGHEKVTDFEWTSKAVKFNCNNMRTGKHEALFDVRAFQNGNMHVRFNQEFLKKLNVEFGRLKGWLKSKEQASEELGIPESEIKTMFNGNKKLSQSNALLLTQG